MKGSEKSSSTPPATIKTSNSNVLKPQKPLFRPAQDDTKPPLKDPVSNLSLSIACAHTENHSLEQILRSDLSRAHLIKAVTGHVRGRDKSRQSQLHLSAHLFSQVSRVKGSSDATSC
uniref:Uncharacterized protein n=1 Tax=Salix viminalis TaxID=40686 RepID=A0A6N2M690_SALVM